MSPEYLECDTSSAVQFFLAFCSQPREVSRLKESPQEFNLVQCRVACLLSAENRLGETMKSPACDCLDTLLGSRAQLDSRHVTYLTQPPPPIKPLSADLRPPECYNSVVLETGLCARLVLATWMGLPDGQPGAVAV